MYTLIAAGSAGAQNAGTAPNTSPTDAGTLQEVVATARRFAEDLQRAPLAVAALSAATIQVQDVTNLEDLNSVVPNMKISADRATSSTINVYIRGVGQSDPLWGNEPGDVRLLVIRGALSDLLSAATVARMAREKPDLQHITVANRGHTPLLNEPECLAAIDAFLAQYGELAGYGDRGDAPQR